MIQRKARYPDLIFLMTVGVFFAWSLVTGILSLTVLPPTHVQNILRLFGIMGLLALLFSHRYLLWGAGALLLAALIFLAVGFLSPPVYPDFEPSLANEAAQFIRQTIAFIVGTGYRQPAFEQAILWALSTGIGLFVVLFAYVRPQFFILLTFSAVIFGLLVTARLFTAHFTFYVFGFCILAFLIRYLNQRHTQNRTGSASFVLYALPLALIAALLASLIPTPQADFSQTIVGRPFRAVNDRLTRAAQPSHFTLRQTGFGGGGGRLGGDTTANDAVFMRIRPSESPMPIYLTGAILDTYTGYAWERSLGESAPLDFGEMYVHLALFERATGGLTSAILHFPQLMLPAFPYTEFGMFETRTMELTNLELRTYSIFQTGLVQDIQPRNVVADFQRDPNGQFSVENRLLRDAWYAVTYIDPDSLPSLATHYRLASREAMLRDANRGFLYAVIQRLEEHGPTRSLGRITHQTAAGHMIEITYEDLLSNYLIPRADWIHETFTALPEDFPARVRERAQAVTADARNDYERARMLEAYLAANYAYTLSPGLPPAGVDFVYHFLFDLQAGYCTYFATAFVTMARSLGLPARYVEGFRLSGDPDDYGYFEVLNSMGHAWGEVYFEGYGWHIFEPTPAHGLPQPARPGGVGMGGYVPGDLWWGDDWDEWLHWEHIHGWGEGGAAVDRGGAVTPGQVGATVRNIGRGILLVLALMFTLFLTRILWVAIRRLRAKREQDNSKAVQYYFATMRKYMKFFRYEMRTGETAGQFATRAGLRFNSKYDDLYLPDIAAIFSKARYSDHTVTDDERAVLANAVTRLDVQMQRATEYWQYRYYKYILAVI